MSWRVKTKTREASIVTWDEALDVILKIIKTYSDTISDACWSVEMLRILIRYGSNITRELAAAIACYSLKLFEDHYPNIKDIARSLDNEIVFQYERFVFINHLTIINANSRIDNYACMAYNQMQINEIDEMMEEALSIVYKDSNINNEPLTLCNIAVDIYCKGKYRKHQISLSIHRIPKTKPWKPISHNSIEYTSNDEEEDLKEEDIEDILGKMFIDLPST